jgi:hypothetical protein
MQKEDQGDGLAHRIEETLVAREKERLEILASQPATTDTDVTRPKKCRKGISFALLTLGFVLGGIIGALCYMLLPAPQATASSTPTPDRVSTLLLQADGLLAAGQKDAARAAYLDALSQNPNSVQAHNNLAVLYAAEGNLPQAREQLDRALKTSPAYQAVHENMARIYAGMARNSYGKALQLDEGIAPVRLEPLGTAASRDSAPNLAVVPSVSPPVEKRPDVGSPTEDAAGPTEPAGAPVAAAESVVDSVSSPVVMPPAVEPALVSVPPSEIVDISTPGAVTVVAKLEKKDMRQATPVSDPVAYPTPQQFLDLWASAWSSQNVKKYLAFYASDYFSSRSGSRANWEDQRRERLTKPGFIEVKLSDFVIAVQTEQRAEVQMIQSYKSDNYRDTTRKLMVLERRDSSWQITDERTLERLN